MGADETLLAELRARRIRNYTVEKRYVRRDETRNWVRVTWSIVEIPTCPYRLSIVEEISERREIEIKEREAETELRQLQSELIHVSRVSALGEIASALAHELNQPISAIANYLNGCRRLLADDRDGRAALVREATEKASEQPLRAGEIIRGSHEFIQPSDVEHRVESLSRLIQEASALGSVGLKKQGIQIVLQLEPQMDAFVNEVQIQEIILNLMRNAIDAMQDGPQQVLIVTTAPVEREIGQSSVSCCGAPSVSRRSWIRPHNACRIFYLIQFTREIPDSIPIGNAARAGSMPHRLRRRLIFTQESDGSPTQPTSSFSQRVFALLTGYNSTIGLSRQSDHQTVKDGPRATYGIRP